MPIRILIVDQQDLYRASLASLLAAQKGFDVVGQAETGKKAVRLAAELRPDVVLMDLRLAGSDETAALDGLLDQNFSVPVIAVSALADESSVSTALSGGFCGYLPKDAPTADVAAAIRAAAQDTPWLAPRAAQAVLNSFDHGDVDRERTPNTSNGYSRREIDVLRILAAGRGNHEIAEELSISPQSAEDDVSSILAKLGLDSRVHGPGGEPSRS